MKLKAESLVLGKASGLVLTLRNSGDAPLNLHVCDMLIDGIAQAFAADCSDALQPETSCRVIIAGKFSAGKHEVAVVREKDKIVFQLECAEGIMQ